ncbi:indole-3-glycerol phosphate synthase TrpC [Raineyella fluvialis]|uniref:Indole-3-glycerol phosphate synthase n=1 Tax=Raineyella fluvialis TaxID=2662261 RepID=A0A5Q2FCJ7_9ACTN|nr:indole-3-glycerol phosphate synthase TrpC [Raineyella fluvialis]QGF24488.1 indole-3-glycerol phosphate synthase TrpC [Raineyella fluvialis]
MGVLDELNAGARADMEERRALTGQDELARRIEALPPARDPLPAFRAPGIAVIAEVKRSSPSAGALAEIADPAALAEAYARGGADAISVLTERRRFGGTLADLVAVRARVDIPVLRKDFVVDDYQLYEARAAGADLALLIVASLTDRELAGLHATALDLGLTPLVETHTADEVRRALDLGAALIGINNRNLDTLEVDTATFARLAPLVPDEVVKVAESGVRTPDDVRVFAEAGADVALIGQALVTGGDPVAGVRAMKEAHRG